MKPQTLSVVITGATDPVGAELARVLVNRGARVLLVSRNAGPLAALARALSTSDDHRHRVDALAADIATLPGCRAVADVAAARGVNALVNAPCADSCAPRTDLDTCTPDAVAAGIAATEQVTRALLPHLLEQREARVLNIGPTCDHGALEDAATKYASRTALRALSEALRRETAGTTVRVQYLGQRVGARAPALRGAQPGGRAGGARNDRPDYIASVALQMLRARTRERFLGLRGDLLGRASAIVAAVLDPAPRHRRA